MISSTTQEKELIASHLRHQVELIQGLLKDVELENRVNYVYTESTLRFIEKSIFQLRKLCFQEKLISKKREV